jgi:RNA polymerase sigma-70 factor (ECF subfamily)
MGTASRDRETRAERFRVLFDRHYSQVLAYSLRRSRHEADAHDVVAETFTVAWRRFDDLPPEDRWLPWLYGVARRVLANQRRRAARQERVVDRLASETERGGFRSEGSDAADLVQQQLAQLRPDDQEILRLAMWETLPHDQIATVLGISTNAVGIRLHRARNRLGRRLEKAGYAGLARGAERPKDSGASRTQKEVKRKPVNGAPDQEPT